MRLESGELRIFHSVARSGGFRAAAQELHLTQSAVSQAIKQLEGKLNQPLLVRDRPVRLTRAGRRLYRHVDDQLQQEQTVLADLSRLARGLDQQLSVAIDSTNNRFAGADLIHTFIGRWPEARLKLVEQPSRAIVPAVMSGEVEMGLGPFQTRMDRFSTEPLYDEHRLLMISPAHPLYRAEMTAGDLRRIPLVVSSLDEPDQRPYQEKLRDNFQMIWQISSLNVRLNLIERGLAVGYISTEVTRQLSHIQHFRALQEFDFARIERQVGLFYRRDRKLSSVARDFIEVCRRYWTESGSGPGRPGEHNALLD
ncbi:LysR family transcriptional regulator [Microbulbifer halophilus]|uniref:LysR family transcriptional regulator n=1 Tax=Microbulbifer halophilus TaxID=453963 RepID=A0ABW5EG44_9GAMM|nr:LysR family transcriptional regulator [Microbulbifer halophilus]MCW8128245.1 LysR family transcriptional regulator [Microbulbifer halophilus]